MGMSEYKKKKKVGVRIYRSVFGCFCLAGMEDHWGSSGTCRERCFALYYFCLQSSALPFTFDRDLLVFIYFWNLNCLLFFFI